MTAKLDRRKLLAGITAASFGSRPDQIALAQPSHTFGFPLAEPGGLPGDGFLIRHGFQTENTWFAPGYWHTAEDWYRLDNIDTAGAHVRSIGAGDVVFAGSNYPGRVVIVQHGPALFSMYGHLDFDTIAVGLGDRVHRGDQIGTVLQRTDAVPSHLHFEIRTFLYEDAVNGATPRYGFECGVWCAPGPGYWPIDAPDLPSAMGWRNPTHVIGNRLLLDGPLTVQVAQGNTGLVALSSAPRLSATTVGTKQIVLAPGTRFAVHAVDAGPEASSEVSAEAYLLSYLIDDGTNVSGWVRAVVASNNDTGSDSRPSSVRFALLPALE